MYKHSHPSLHTNRCQLMIKLNVPFLSPIFLHSIENTRDACSIYWGRYALFLNEYSRSKSHFYLILPPTSLSLQETTLGKASLQFSCKWHILKPSDLYHLKGVANHIESDKVCVSFYTVEYGSMNPGWAGCKYPGGESLNGIVQYYCNSF